MIDILYELYQSKGIADANANASNAQDRVSRVFDEIAILRKRLSSLSLVNAAMWELLKEKSNITDIELKSKILEIDAADGVVDGKMGSAMRKCCKCGKSLHPRHGKCLYCGEDNGHTSIHSSI